MSKLVMKSSSPPRSRQMLYRQLGRTELRVSILGFGASPLGDVYGATNPAEGERAVHMAIHEGINFFDVSPYYGLNLAEERLGAALQGRRRQVILATKCGRYGTSDFDFSERQVYFSVEESLRRLRTDYIDLLQAHDIEFASLQQIVDETIPAMKRMQEQGKVRYIGITGYPLNLLLRTAAATSVDTILSYCHYNLLVDDMDTSLAPFAESRGLGLINGSPLHMGLLTEQGAPDWHPAPAEVHEAAKRALEFCRNRGIDLSELALRYCLDYPRVATTLVGMATREQVESSVRAVGSPADVQTVRQVQAIFRPVFNLSWRSGRPENQ